MGWDKSPLSGMKHGVHWITKRIAQGQFASPARSTILRDQQITHILNVGESKSVVVASEYGFESVVDVPIIDLQLIPSDIAITAIDTLHRMLAETDSHVFIHCIAGQNRSPTILWLFFLACGIPAEDASLLITRANPDAVPGHGMLVDEDLVAKVIAHGAANFLPLTDLSMLESAF